jgi:hypothetical protein
MKTMMKFGQNKLRAVVFSIAALIAAGAFLPATESNSASDLDYFKGNWTVTMRNNPKISFNWTVREDLDKSWLGGEVTRDGQNITKDFWRQREKKIERFAFTSNNTFVRLESAGWNGDRLIFNGTLSDGASETKVRETITKVNDKQFNALWERQDANGTWTVFGDEICTK